MAADDRQLVLDLQRSGYGSSTLIILPPRTPTRRVSGRLQRELERVEAFDIRSIILDLSGLTFMDSTAVQLLLSATIAHAQTQTA
jgi:anti-anti-sigma regulatory factor